MQCGGIGHGFPLPLNPAVENVKCTLRTDTDGNESWDLTRAAELKIFFRDSNSDSYILISKRATPTLTPTPRF